MSIDTSATPPLSASTLPKRKSKRLSLDLAEQDWTKLVRGKTKAAEDVFGDAVKSGQIYRWGIAVATALPDGQTQPPDNTWLPWDERQPAPLLHSLSRLACDSKTKKSHDASIDWFDVVRQATECFESFQVPTTDQAALAVLWAAVLPHLPNKLEAAGLSKPADPDAEDHGCVRLTNALLDLHEAILIRGDVTSANHLILGGELGLTLAMRLPGLPKRAALIKHACKAIADWAEYEDESIGETLKQPATARLTLASLIRCRSLSKSIAGKKFSKQTLATADQLATWVAAMTYDRGGSAFSSATPAEAKDDVGKHGVLQAAKQFDPETLGPAVDAAIGMSPTGGRLAWEVSLPESMWCDETAKLAVMLPEWDVARGRIHVDFSGQDVAVEIFAGRARTIAGKLKTSLDIDGVSQQPAGDWDEICRYSDDDVHYLELEQRWTSDFLIQRQFFLIREDQCVLFADAIVPSAARDPQKIDYQVSLPLDATAAAVEEQETREVFLRCDDLSGENKKNGNRAIMLPIAASEWKIGPTASKLILADPDCVLFQASGHGRLYAPVWIDFARRRFKRKRTWRQLTVGDSLELVDKHDAVAFRVQVGSEQWVMYRSMGDQRCRTFLGKHMMADFYVSRFDTGDGTHDALITVDDRPEES